MIQNKSHKTWQWFTFVALVVVLNFLFMLTTLVSLTPVFGAEKAPTGSPAVAWASATYTVTEGTNPLTVTVVLTPTSLMTVTVDVQDTAGTATPTVDYEPVSQTLTLLPEQITYTLPITIFDNSAVTGDRSFMLVLSNPSQATLGEIITTTITIMEDDEVITPTYQAFLPAVYQTADVTDERWANEFWRSGTDAPVASTAVDENDNLYIGGRFNYVSDIKAKYIAKWDGSEWHPVGEGLANPAAQIATGPEGMVYAAESTNCNVWYDCRTFRISQWDGTEWLTISPHITGTIYELLVDNQNVYVAGNFDTIGEENVPNLAVWDGETWSAVGGGANDYVRDILFDNNGDLLATGGFTQIGSVATGGLAKWDGTVWSDFPVSEMMIAKGHLGVDAQNNIYVALTSEGMFSGIYKWDGTNWAWVATPGNGVRDLLVSPAGELYAFPEFSYYSSEGVYSLSINSQGTVYAGGRFTSLEGTTVSNVAQEVEGQWGAIGENGLGVSGQVNAVVVADNGDVYIGGAFIYAGSTTVNHIAKWDGESWSALDEGVDGIVHALALDSQGNLYAGGEFQMAGAVLAPRLAKWDGQNWFGIDAINGNVYAIAINSQDHLYIGGDFTITGDTVTNRIAKWDGQDWHSLQDGISGTPGTIMVWDIAIDAQDNVYIGGEFYVVGGKNIPALAKWDGQTWSKVGLHSLTGRYSDENIVYALEFDRNGHLFATGPFDYVGDRYDPELVVNGIARWDGQNWHSLDEGLLGYGSGYDRGYELAHDLQGNIYVGGYFYKTGSNPTITNYIARWDGEAWHALGSGVRKFFPLDNPLYRQLGVYALAADNNGNLYVGGNFVSAGSKPAVNFSIWRTR